jgi:hypothetical protein
MRMHGLIDALMNRLSCWPGKSRDRGEGEWRGVAWRGGEGGEGRRLRSGDRGRGSPGLCFHGGSGRPKGQCGQGEGGTSGLTD